MNTIFYKPRRDELIERVHSLDNNNTAQWGKMNLYQMLRHCNFWHEWVLGKTDRIYKQEFIGRIFGKMALKGMVKDDRPMKKNMPAGSAFTIKDKAGDIAQEKIILVNLIAEYDHFSNPAFVHDFFGRMTEAEIGILAYKHSDHHLRQFGR